MTQEIVRKTLYGLITVSGLWLGYNLYDNMITANNLSSEFITNYEKTKVDVEKKIADYEQNNIKRNLLLGNYYAFKSSYNWHVKFKEEIKKE